LQGHRAGAQNKIWRRSYGCLRGNSRPFLAELEYLAPPFWRRICGASHSAVSCFGARLFWRKAVLSLIYLITITHTSLSLEPSVFHLARMFFKQATVFANLCCNSISTTRKLNVSWKHRRKRQGDGEAVAPPPVLKHFRLNSVFRERASCSKILNDKNIAIKWKFSGQLCFQGKAQVAQKFWIIKNIYTIQWKFSGQLCFSGQAQVAQKSWTVKKFSIQCV